MSNKIPFKQDLPPKGGYPQLQIGRIKTWSPKPWALAGAFAAFLPVAYYLGVQKMRKIKLEGIADDEVRACLEPLIKAESDRLLMWQMRRNREEENSLMKNVPGWETGTWFGEPVYKTNKNYDVWINPSATELYAHTSKRDYNDFMFANHKSF